MPAHNELVQKNYMVEGYMKETIMSYPVSQSGEAKKRDLGYENKTLRIHLASPSCRYLKKIHYQELVQWLLAEALVNVAKVSSLFLYGNGKIENERKRNAFLACAHIGRLRLNLSIYVA